MLPPHHHLLPAPLHPSLMGAKHCKLAEREAPLIHTLLWLSPLCLSLLLLLMLGCSGEAGDQSRRWKGRREGWRRVRRAPEGESIPMMWRLLSKMLFTSMTERLFTNTPLRRRLPRSSLTALFLPYSFCSWVMCLMISEGQAGQRITMGGSVMKCSSAVLYKDDKRLQDAVI